MDEAALFNQEDAVNYRVLQRISNQNALTLATDVIQSEFGQTKYKLNKMFDTLNADLVEVSDDVPSYLDDLAKGYWRGHHLTKVILQKIRLLYLQRGYLFTVFEYQQFFSTRVSKTVYMRDHYISNAKFYETAERLKYVLTTQEFLPPHAPADTEFATRLALFQLYFTAYNGVASPFQELDPTVAKLIHALQEALTGDLLPTQLTKLQFFLKIWLLRMLNGQHITKCLPGDQQLAGASGRLKALKGALPASFGINDQELDYLYAFLVIWHYLPQAEESQVLARAQLPLATTLTDEFLALVKANQLLDGDLDQALTTLQPILLAFHLQLITFYLAPTTFIDDTQISFFRNLYPAFDHLILTFIAHLNQAHIVQLNHTMAVNLYFSYMFTLINYLPTMALHDRVFVCVDFAQGQIYSDYIVRTLASFDNAFLVIEPQLSKHTDLYLSDFHDAALSIPQVTWANPPTPADWQELAELTIQIKHTKLKPLTTPVADPFDLNPAKEATTDEQTD